MRGKEQISTRTKRRSEKQYILLNMMSHKTLYVYTCVYFPCQQTFYFNPAFGKYMLQELTDGLNLS